MPVTVVDSNDPAWVLTEAGGYLASDPVRHNLILTLLHKGASHPENAGRYWVAMEDGAAVGLVLQSRHHVEATLTPMAAGVVTAMVEAIARTDAVLTGVHGEAATAACFAGGWTERRNTGAVPFYGLRIYEWLAPGEQPAVPGRLRQAAADDRDLLAGWIRAFQSETGEGGTEPGRFVDLRLAAGLFWLWEDTEPASMAAFTEPLAGVVRVQAVYTPPGMRSRGYASACVDALSAKLRARGHRCILYTDLGNPASNAIYRRLGYRAVAEGLRYRFQ